MIVRYIFFIGDIKSVKTDVFASTGGVLNTSVFSDF